MITCHHSGVLLSNVKEIEESWVMSSNVVESIMLSNIELSCPSVRKKKEKEGWGHYHYIFGLSPNSHIPLCSTWFGLQPAEGRSLVIEVFGIHTDYLPVKPQDLPTGTQELALRRRIRKDPPPPLPDLRYTAKSMFCLDTLIIRVLVDRHNFSHGPYR
jgi:hypothetical protein